MTSEAGKGWLCVSRPVGCERIARRRGPEARLKREAKGVAVRRIRIRARVPSRVWSERLRWSTHRGGRLRDVGASFKVDPPRRSIPSVTGSTGVVQRTDAPPRVKRHPLRAISVIWCYAECTEGPDSIFSTLKSYYTSRMRCKKRETVSKLQKELVPSLGIRSAVHTVSRHRLILLVTLNVLLCRKYLRNMTRAAGLPALTSTSSTTNELPKIWKGAQFNIRDLQSPPKFFDRKFLSPPKRLAPASPSASASLPQSPRASAIVGSHAAALETFIRQKLAPLGPNAPERLVAFRHAFNEIIGRLPTFGPLLAEIKLEYERALDNATADVLGGGLLRGGAMSGAMQPRLLHGLHPLQLPSSFYESQWRYRGELCELAKVQMARQQQLITAQRAACAEVLLRLTAIGALEAPPAPRGTAAPALTAAVPSIEAALAESLAVVNDQLEATVGAELERLRERLSLLEMRATTAARVSDRVTLASKEARVQLERIVDDLLLQAKKRTEARAPENAFETEQTIKVLQALLTKVVSLEDQTASMVRLLKSWDPEEIKVFVSAL